MISRTGQIGRLVAVLVAVGGLTACGDDGPTGPQPVTIAELEGVYATEAVTFDPQGSAPTGDVLAALEATGTSPELNIGATGSFQLFFRDPETRNIVTLGGTVQPTVEGARLVFSSQEQADEFLFPRTLPLDWDEAEGTLAFSGSAEVSEVRLRELFPELYAEEQFVSPTPGLLTVRFRQAAE